MAESHSMRHCRKMRSSRRRTTTWATRPSPVPAISSRRDRISVYCLRHYRRSAYRRATNTAMSQKRSLRVPEWSLSPTVRPQALHESVGEPPHLEPAWIYRSTNRRTLAIQRPDTLEIHFRLVARLLGTSDTGDRPTRQMQSLHRGTQHRRRDVV